MSKYHSQKTIALGRQFDSRAEANRYRELVMMLKAGIVTDIECQPVFVLQDKFKKHSKTIREIKYIADFKVTYADGHVEIEDVKSGPSFRTEKYLLKKKLFDYKYRDLTIREIY